MQPYCPCGYDSDTTPRFSEAWEIAHKAKHLETYPNVDQTTVRNLDDAIARAAR